MNSNEESFKKRSIENMQRITRQEVADRLDELMDIMDKEDVGFVITKDGKDDLLLCPAHWFGEFVDPDFGLMINCAVRYALDRNTYMPDVVMRFVKRNINALDEHTIRCMIEDLNREDYLETMTYKAEWMSLKAQLEERLLKIQN